MGSTEWFDLILGPGGLLVGLLILVVTGVKKMWVFGWYATALETDRDYWKQMAVRSLTAAEKATDVAKSAQDQTPSGVSGGHLTDEELLAIVRARGLG
jgi:hypothetical protein